MRRGGWSAVVAAVGLLGSLTIYQHWWRDPQHLSLGHTHTDPIQAMWNLAWLPWALGHGYNPFHTDALYYPHGVALSWNTLMPTLGLVAAPLTLLLGVAVTFAIAMTLAPALATLTAFWWLRRHVARPAAAAVAALVVAFNPYMTGHLLGHLNLVFIALIPVQLMLLEDLLWRRPRPQRRSAILLGVVTALQAGIDEELVLIVAIAVCVALLAFTGLGGRGAASELRAALRSAVKPVALAVGVFVVVAAPLLVNQFLLSPSVPLQSAYWRALPVDYVTPQPTQWLRFHHFLGVLPVVHQDSRIHGAENGVYMGYLLPIVLLAGIYLTRRDVRVRIAAAVVVVMVVLTFGAAHPWGIPMPWNLVQSAPVFKSVLPARFGFAMWLAIALLVAVWLDALVARWAAAGDSRRRVAVGLGVAALAVGLLPLVPRVQRALPLQRVPHHLTAARLRLPDGAPVLLLPLATAFDGTGMYAQLQADFTFRMPGGYALRPDHDAADASPPPSPLVNIAQSRSWSSSQLSAATAQLASQRYRAIVVLDWQRTTAHSRALARALTGRGPDQLVDGAEVWHLH